MTLPEGPYDLIYADPAWKFSSNSAARPGRNAMRHYPCMTDAELCALPVRNILAKDALLVMWTTAPMLRRAMEIPPAWGFPKYLTEIVWRKERPATGYWAQGLHEPVLLFKRGKFPCRRPFPFGKSVFDAPQREHSRKPPNLRDAINAKYPDMRKLEMFARAPADGWDVWGNDTEKFTADVLK